MSETTQKFRPTTPKPHRMAVPADAPCVACGGEWLRPVIDLSDEEAEEIPMFMACAGCKTRPPKKD